VRTNGGRLFQTVGAQQENRRDAEFVDVDSLHALLKDSNKIMSSASDLLSTQSTVDCVDSRSDADDIILFESFNKALMKLFTDL